MILRVAFNGCQVQPVGIVAIGPMQQIEHLILHARHEVVILFAGQKLISVRGRDKDIDVCTETERC